MLCLVSIGIYTSQRTSSKLRDILCTENKRVLGTARKRSLRLSDSPKDSTL